MGKNKRTLELHSLYNLKCTECFAKTHLSVPKHLAPFLELLVCHFYGLQLLWTEIYRLLRRIYIFGVESLPSSLDSFNRFYNRGRITFKPFNRFSRYVEISCLDSGILST